MCDLEEEIVLPKGTKKFNLDNALAGDTVVNGCGLKVTNLTFYETQGAYCLAGIQHLQGKTRLHIYTEEGHFDQYNQRTDSNLYMKATPTTLYVNLYKSCESTNIMLESGNLYSTESEAVEKRSPTRFDSYVGTYPITVNL